MRRFILAIIATAAAGLGFWLSVRVMYLTPTGADFSATALRWSTNLLVWVLPLVVTKAASLVFPVWRDVSCVALSAGAALGLGVGAFLVATFFGDLSSPTWMLLAGSGAVSVAFGWLGTYAS